MEKKRKSGTAYLMQLAGKYKLHLFVSALFGMPAHYARLSRMSWCIEASWFCWMVKEMLCAMA